MMAHPLRARLAPYVLAAAVFSFVLNILLLAPSVYMLQVFDRVLTSRSAETLVMLTAAVAIALAMMAALDVVRSYLLAAIGVALDGMLSGGLVRDMLEHTARLGSREHAAALRDLQCVRGFFGGAGILALFDAPWLPFFVVIIALFHPWMGMMALAGALLMVILAFLNERVTRGPVERAQTEARRAARFMEASLRNAEAATALGMVEAVAERWKKLNDKALAEQRRATRSGGAFSGLTKFSRQVIQSAMLALGAYIVLDQQASPGVMIAATILLGRALAPVEQLVAGWKSLVEARAAWRRLKPLLDAPPRPVATELPVPKGQLALEGVALVLPGRDRAILRGVQFSLAAGEALGVIGPSASGKSSLARLIAGLWRPSAGVVRLDGADVGQWDRGRLGRHIGYLPQDVELFPGTVAENIARLQTPDDVAVVRAAQRANVHELILRLPKGYETELGEVASALSPGQRQRIALARALYGEPRLVVLDEPNSNLDDEGEQALLAALQELKRAGATLIIVAHRPAVLAVVDRVLVVHEGVVQAYGPRAEILARLVRRAA